MEQSLKQATTLQVEKNLDAYNHIELSELEIKEILYEARKKKAGKLAEIEYLKKLNEPKVYPKLNYDQLREFVLSENKYYILDGDNTAIFEMLCMYFSGDEAFELQGDGFSLNKGIMLYGAVGCGKTSLMRMFQHNTFRPFCINPCRKIADSYASEGANALYHYSTTSKVMPQMNNGFSEIGRCYDDLGTENSKKNFGNEVNVMQDVLYKVYDNNLIGNFHLTTNIIGDDIEQFYGVRIRSRMREMFNVIAFNVDSKDRRK
jgi:DNA replication protein DnaC